MTNRYKGNITTILHHINMMVKRDWSDSDTNAFEDETKISKLAELSGMSCRNLQLYFHAYTNETIGKYKNRIRLEYTLQLLKEGRYRQSEIAERVGLANDTALYNIFRKKLDSTPAGYKACFLTEPTT
jgi:transcriptional regulator GlxA family with amidase domain